MKPTRVSYSSISSWEQCPRFYKYVYVEGLKSQSGPAAARGSRLHLALEKFLKGQLPEEKLPIDFWRIRKQLTEWKKIKAKSEQEWNVTRSWKICKNEDPNIFIKAIVDVHYLVAKSLYITDLKTGSIYDEHRDQLQIYALLGLLKYPKVEDVYVSGLYADQGRSDMEATYKRSILPHLKHHWKERGEAVLNDTVYEAKPSIDNCRYCSFSQFRGGPCKLAVK